MTLELAKVVHMAHFCRILILAGAVYHRPGVGAVSADISDAYSLLRDVVGRGRKLCNLRATVTHCSDRGCDHIRPSASVFWPECITCGHRWGADSLGRFYSLACLGKHFLKAT